MIILIYKILYLIRKILIILKRVNNIILLYDYPKFSTINFAILY